MQNICSIKNLYFNIPDKPLFSGINIELPRGYTGLVGNNGCGKSTFLETLSGSLKPDQGSITWYSDYLKVDQARDIPQHRVVDIFDPKGLYDCFSRIESGSYCEEDLIRVADSWELPTLWQQNLYSAGINLTLDTPVENLSGGERVLLDLIHAFSHKNHYLLLDEPGNHLDSTGKEWLLQKIHNHRAGILMVSHDRELLQQANTILELNSEKLRTYGGNYSNYQEVKKIQGQSIERKIENTKKKVNSLNKLKQSSSNKTATRRNQGKKLQGSQCKSLLDAKKDRAGRSLGKLSRNLDRQYQNLKQELESAQKGHTIDQPVSMHLNRVGLTGGIRLHLDGLKLPYGSYSESLSFTMHSGDRWHIRGANGSGKSTLLKVIAGQLKPAGGLCRTFGSCFYLDQHLSQLNGKISALENLTLLHPDTKTNYWRTALATLNIRGDSAFRPTNTLSGGERLKVVLLAATRGAEAPDLLLLDEPDNHLDLESRIALETALIEYPGTFLLISHDSSFVEKVGVNNEICL
ncbi:ATP-binding cassette domain-containing protein [Microbulbifer sp. A4B17]|uniref:ATP-binding cassette domain-containing protein n=1 Tax=Microbulbifer sp. A4B17 TaxID=359370 RepID=UPI0018641EDA|nr:ATP-binding cassette domain-containing protein [Microbulbifer sp. A4B17]